MSHQHKKMKLTNMHPAVDNSDDTCSKSFYTNQSFSQYFNLTYSQKVTEQSLVSEDHTHYPPLHNTVYQPPEMFHERRMYCSKCTFVATKRITFEIHQTVHNSKPPYKCEFCEHMTSDPSNFNDHIFTHVSKEKSFSCLFCISSFSTSIELQEHLDSQHQDRIEMKCNQCDFRTSLPTEFLNHKEQCHPVSKTPEKRTILQCEQCSFISTKPVSLQLHQIVHLTKPPYRCTKCNYETISSGNFNYHILGDNQDKPFNCPHCSEYFFISKYNLHRHIRSHHPDQILKCDQCEFTAPFQSMLFKHKNQYHSAEIMKPRQMKPVEPLSLEMQKTLQNHVDGVVIDCEKCTFIATKRASMELHRIVHANSPPYKCEICKYQTPSSTRFNVHIRAHHKDKPFWCHRCEKKFGESSNLVRHLRSIHLE